MNDDAEIRQRTVLDSEVQQAGDVYGKALFGAAEKAGAIDETLEELRGLVEDVLPSQPRFLKFLESPKVDSLEKRRVLEETFRGRVRPETLNLLRILADNRRFGSLGAIYASYRTLVQKLRREVDVSVTTAQPLTEELRELVRAKLSASLGKKVHLKERLDEDLIGGLVVRVGDTVFDASLAGQFERIRDSALASARTQMRTAFDRFAVSEPQSP